MLVSFGRCEEVEATFERQVVFSDLFDHQVNHSDLVNKKCAYFKDATIFTVGDRHFGGTISEFTLNFLQGEEIGVFCSRSRPPPNLIYARGALGIVCGGGNCRGEKGRGGEGGRKGGREGWSCLR